MAVATFNKFNYFVQDVGDKLHNLNSDTLKIMLTNTIPVATNHLYSDISANELANGNGYTTGGIAVGSSAFSQTSGTATLTGNAVVWTATGAMGPFEYAVLYNSTAASKNLIGWWDYGSAVTLSSGETFTANENSQSTGGSILTLA